jgi:hypothetical protein
MGLNYKVVCVTGQCIDIDTLKRLLGIKQWKESTVHDKIRTFNANYGEIKIHRLHGEVADNGGFFAPIEPYIVIGVNGARNIETVKTLLINSISQCTARSKIEVYAGICIDCCE